MNEYRDEALSKLDVLSFFGRYVGQLKRLNDQEYKFLCPFHDDKDPSANVNVRTSAWFCHACGAKGSAVDLVMLSDKKVYKEALAVVGDAAGLPPPSLGKKTNGQDGPAAPAKTTAKLTEEMVKGWHDAALRNADLMRWFTDHRGYTVETVDKYQLGWDSQRVTIPIRDAAGKLVNVRRYLRDSKGSTGKMLGFAAGMNEARLFPIDALADAEVVLVEGEWDAILLRQYGFNAMSVTSGAGVFNNEWVELFSDKQVTICYDNDKAGQDGAISVAAKLATNLLATVLIATIPGLPDKGDVTDFFVEQARSVEELTTLLMDAAPFIVAPAAEQTTPTKVPLADASNAKWRDTLLAVAVLMSGKAMTPFTVPFDWTTKCDMSNKRLCGGCPLKLKSGVSRTTLSARDPRALELINVTTAAQQGAMRKMAGAVDQCNRGVNTVHASVNIEELRVIPEIDTGQNAAEAEHVSRTAYFIGHGLRSNRGYEMRGYTHPLPKTQATVHVFSDAIPAQDNISSFVMTPEVRERLRVFNDTKGDVEGRMRAIYDDLRVNLHRIQGRFDMQVAYDLVWHSVIAFTFNGSYVRRGWAECMVIGDSGQGKTEMAMELLRHYRMGERVQGEQASLAGLIGGLEKMADTWMLGWGKVPQNDKRLLVIDETQGLQAGQIEAMSDVRATGVAEITKIRTERTNARCRLIWLANPVSGMPLTAHNQGVLAIKELFKKPEDIRRLDFAITVASGDVALSEINAAHGAPGEPVYSSDACRELILWAWSRRPDQVIFTPEATVAILQAAMKMGSDYSSAIPLVEPADQRIKLARLAAACAARVFSTDDGERVIVKPEHVAFVVTYLNRIFSAPSMAYDEYSGQAKQGEVLTEAEESRVRGAIEAWTNTADAQLFFRQARIFKKSELVDTLGWDEPYAKAQLRFLTSSRLIRSVRDGQAKTPVFIQLLRAMHTGVKLADIPSEEEAPF